MEKSLRIIRLERLWTDERAICSHAFSLIVDGRMVQDDPSCSCGGERITLIAAYVDEPRVQETQLSDDNLLARAKGV